MMTARSMAFCSSRILPGHRYCLSISIVSSGILVISLPWAAAYLRTKYSARSEMSSCRSRKGGSVIGKN